MQNKRKIRIKGKNVIYSVYTHVFSEAFVSKPPLIFL